MITIVDVPAIKLYSALSHDLTFIILQDLTYGKLKLWPRISFEQLVHVL
jgi:hypothetical protein